MIPKIIHMMWLGNKKHDSNGLESFKKFNPDWSIYFWDDDKIDELINIYFPNYKLDFNKIEKIINKCDIARFMVLYVHGGIYVDLDFYCIRSLNELTQFDILLFREISEHEYRGGQLLNGFVGMIPGRQDCLNFIDNMFYNLKIKNKKDINYVMDTTGPRAFYEFFKDYDYFSGCSVSPFTNKQRISSSCNINNLMYAYTNWDEGSGWNKKNNNKKILFLIILSILIIQLFFYIIGYNPVNQIKYLVSNFKRKITMF